MKKVFQVALIGLFVIAFIVLLVSAKKDSQTTDEGVHLFAGYTYLKERDFRLDPEHPPLLKELSAVPLLFMSGLKVPMGDAWEKAANFYYDSWQEARAQSETFLYLSNHSPEQLLFWGRLPFIFLTLLLGYFAFFWANKLYGPKAGFFAAILTLFMPNILAHGRLINTDLGLTLFLFIGFYFWGKFLKKPNAWNLILCGLIFGLSFASKFTSALAIPIIIFLAIIKLYLDSDLKNWFKYFVGVISLGLIGFFVVWASYGFLLTAPPPPIGSFSTNIKLWANYNIPTLFDGFINRVRPYLIPADYYKGLALVIRHALGGHSAYMLGQNSSQGWWYYFPVAIFYKTPLAFWGFVILSIAYFKKIRTKLVFDELVLITVPMMFLLISMNSKADLGVRHVLPIFPFLIVFASKSINLIHLPKIKRLKLNNHLLYPAGFAVLILWFLVSSFLSFPNYISYFNEIAGGPKGGIKVLADSNLDWGQDIFRIKNYIEKHPGEKYSLTYPWDGNGALSYYGLNYPLVRPDDLEVSGNVIISATYALTDAYSWLRVYPYDYITPGVIVYHLGDQN